MPRRVRTTGLAALWLAAIAPIPVWAEQGPSAAVTSLPRVSGAAPRNVVFILADDHRYDAMGFLGHPVVETPALDRIARRGVTCATPS